MTRLQKKQSNYWMLNFSLFFFAAEVYAGMVSNTRHRLICGNIWQICCSYKISIRSVWSTICSMASNFCWISFCLLRQTVQSENIFVCLQQVSNRGAGMCTYVMRHVSCRAVSQCRVMIGVLYGLWQETGVLYPPHLQILTCFLTACTHL